VELLVAVGILAITATALILGFINTLFLNETSHNLVLAANDAQYVLEQLKYLTFDQIPSYTPPTFYNLPSEVVILSSTAVSSTLTKITLDVNWQERNNSRNFSLSTYFAK
jgi:type II secretory pathway pseudopilin PulG